MKRRKLEHGRPQAWLGAITSGIGLATNIIAANKQAKAQEKEAAKQYAINSYNNAVTEANNLSQVLTAARDRENEYLDDFHVNYACGGKVRPKAGFGDVIKTALPFLATGAAGLLASKGGMSSDITSSPEWQEKYGDDLYAFRNGGKVGRRRLRTGGVITDGGVAIPLDDDTFLLQGSSHNQINESGNTGIGIDVNGEEIEAEGGEVVDFDGDSLRIFSDRIELPRRRYLAKGGYVKLTPAEAVMAGYNKDKVFRAQQSVNGNRNINKGKANLGANVPRAWLKRKQNNPEDTSDYDYEYAYTSNIDDNLNVNLDNNTFKYTPWKLGLADSLSLKHNVEPFEYTPKVSGINFNLGDYSLSKPKTYNEIVQGGKTKPLKRTPLISGRGFDLTWGDVANAGIGVLGSIISNSIAQRGYNNLLKYAPDAPSPFLAAKLKTYYNIHPRLAEIERNRLRTQEAIDNNTWISVSSLDRQNTNNVNSVTAANKLWGEKENEETKLINADRLNQQEIDNKTTDAMNKYRLSLADYNRGLRLGKIQSNVAMIQGIGSSSSNMLQAGMDRYDDNLAKIAILGQAEPSTLTYLAAKYPRLFKGLS